MNCEICGREVKGAGISVKLEGSVVMTCRACARLGERPHHRTPGKQTRPASVKRPAPRTEKVIEVVDDYAKVVRQSREGLGLTQDELGSKINEKGSVISRIESGSMEPSIKLARKLERFLSVTLLEELES